MKRMLAVGGLAVLVILLVHLMSGRDAPPSAAAIEQDTPETSPGVRGHQHRPPQPEQVAEKVTTAPEESPAADAGVYLARGRQAQDCVDFPLTLVAYEKALASRPADRQPNPSAYRFVVDRIVECADVPRDHDYVIEQFKTAADLGSIEGMYEYARAVMFSGADMSSMRPQDIADRFRALEQEQFDYFLRAAKAGHLESAYLLAQRYQMGDKYYDGSEFGVLREPDHVEAYAWYYAIKIARSGQGPRTWETELTPILERTDRLLEAQVLGQQYYAVYLANRFSE